MGDLEDALKEDNVTLAAYLYTVPPNEFREEINQLQTKLTQLTEELDKANKEIDELKLELIEARIAGEQ